MKTTIQEEFAKCNDCGEVEAKQLVGYGDNKSCFNCLETLSNNEMSK